MKRITAFYTQPRQDVPPRPPQQRAEDFEELHGAFDEATLRQQAARCMNCGTPYCHSGVNWRGMGSGCALGNLIPEWNDLVYQGNYHEAWVRLVRTNPFPEFTGRICPAPCEGSCTCGLVGEPVTIREIERFLADSAYENGWHDDEAALPASGKTVGVVGSGPAGLTAAWLLHRQGHEVTVYEKADRPGGLLMYGIPNMKLPKDVVLRRVEGMKKMGIRFEYGVDAADPSVAKRLEKAHDAVLLCCGAEVARDLNVPGRDLPGVELAVPYLARATRAVLEGGENTQLRGKRVVVIGGGDTGNDCVATAIRQGAVSVVQLEIMPPAPGARAADNPWPRWPQVKKTDYGQQEAAAAFGQDPRLYQTQTVAIEGDCCVQRLQIEQVEWANKDGRRIPVPVNGSRKQLDADAVLLAMGFVGADPGILSAFDARRADTGAYQTTRAGLFSAGDMRTGQSLVVRAMADAVKAAAQVDDYLKG